MQWCELLAGKRCGTGLGHTETGGPEVQRDNTAGCDVSPLPSPATCPAKPRRIKT